MVTNGSTKSYLEADLTTPTQACRSVTDRRISKAFHQNNLSTPTPYILLENQSTVNVFCNPALLWKIRASGRALHLSCNTGTVPSNQAGDLHGYVCVWYHPKGIANILGMSKVADNEKYWARYDSQEIKDFIVTGIKDGKETHFCRALRDLHWLDNKTTKNDEDGEVLINTVENNKCRYTRCSYLHAKLYGKLQRIIG